MPHCPKSVPISLLPKRFPIGASNSAHAACVGPEPAKGLSAARSFHPNHFLHKHREYHPAGGLRRKYIAQSSRRELVPIPSALSSPLKVPTRTHQRHTLIHDRLPDPKVVFHPLLYIRRL